MTQTAIVDELGDRFGAGTFGRQETGDGIPTVWTTKERSAAVRKAQLSAICSRLTPRRA